MEYFVKYHVADITKRPDFCDCLVLKSNFDLQTCLTIRKFRILQKKKMESMYIAKMAEMLNVQTF